MNKSYALSLYPNCFKLIKKRPFIFKRQLLKFSTTSKNSVLTGQKGLDLYKNQTFYNLHTVRAPS